MLKHGDPAMYFDQAKGARRILVMDLGFLGDAIHLIPALYSIRQAMPEAKLDVVISSHVTDILKLTPWIDRVIGYQRFPKRLPWYKDLVFMARLWRSNYDCVINFNGSDRSSRLSWATMARLRLGRVPNKANQRGLWKWLQTHLVREPFDEAPMYIQLWNCLKKAGFPMSDPTFQVTVPEAVQKDMDLRLADTHGFIHLSPFASMDYKEIPPTVLAEAVGRLQALYPSRPWVISCAPTERERQKLKTFLGLLSKPPDWVFDGNLNVLQLAALIRRSALHLGGDSGALHVALIMDVPAVSWFRFYQDLDQWRPRGTRYLSLIGQIAPNGMVDIDANRLVEAVCAQELHFGK
jgi:ADP-heptose:LPS heptosyltransferase